MPAFLALRPERVPQDADRLHPAARSRLRSSSWRSCRRAPRSRAPTRCNAPRRRHRAARCRASRSAVNIVGFSGATFTNAPNAGAAVPCARHRSRSAQGTRTSRPPAIQAAAVPEARRHSGSARPGRAAAAGRGIGNAGGFRMMVEDRAGAGRRRLQAATSRDDGTARRRRRACSRCSRCSRRRRRSSISISTAPRRSCSASTCRTCSRALQVLPRLGLRQRLQPVRPHVPRHRAGE